MNSQMKAQICRNLFLHANNQVGETLGSVFRDGRKPPQDELERLLQHFNALALQLTYFMNSLGTDGFINVTFNPEGRHTSHH